MTQTNFLELAKTGEPRVIAGLLNRSLQSQGITTKATRRSNELHLLLEGESLKGHEASIVEYLEQALSRLQVPAMRIHIYARLPGQEAVIWRHDLAYDGPKVAGPPTMLSNFTLPMPEIAEPEMTSDVTQLEPQQFDDFQMEETSNQGSPVSFGSVDFLEESSGDMEGSPEEDGVPEISDVYGSESYGSEAYGADPYSNGVNGDGENSNGHSWMDADAGDSVDSGALDYEDSDRPEASRDLAVPEFEADELPQKSGFPLLPLSLAAIVALIFAGAGAYYRFFLFEQPSEPLTTIPSEPLPVATPPVVTSTPPTPEATVPTPEGTVEVPPAEVPVETTPAASPAPGESPEAQPIPKSTNPWRDAINAAMKAAQLAQTAQTAQEWGTVAETWDQSIQLLLMVPTEDPNYLLAQDKVVEYTNNLDIARAQELKALGQ